MPESTYPDDVYSLLKQSGGEKFTMSPDDFKAKISSDDNYIKDVYSLLKLRGGDRFTITPDEFSSKVKKKVGTLPSGTGTIPLSEAKNVFGETVLRAANEDISSKTSQLDRPADQVGDPQETQRQANLQALSAISPAGPAVAGGYEMIRDVFKRQIPSWYNVHMAKAEHSALRRYQDQYAKIYDIPDSQEIVVPSDMPTMASPTGLVMSRPSYKIKAGDYKNQLQSKITSAKTEFITDLDKALTAWQQETDRITTDDIRKVKSPADFVGWLGSSVGNALANIPMSLLTGGAESMMAESGLTYLDGIIKKADELSQKEGKVVTPKEVIERGEDGYAYSLAFGVPAGAIDFIGALAGGTGIIKSIGEKTLRKAVTAWGLGAFAEGVTEPIQNFLNDMGQYYQLGGTNYVDALKQAVAGIPQGLSEGLSAFAGTGILGLPGITSRISSAERTNFVEQKSGNAVQEQETAKVDVQVPAKDGEGVGTGNQLQEPAGESTQGVEETQEVAETPQTRLSSAITEFISKRPLDQPITDQLSEKPVIPDLQKILKDKGVDAIVSDMGDGRYKINLQDENGEIQSSVTVGDVGTDTVAEKGHFAIRTTDTPEKINETINRALEYGGLQQPTESVTEQPQVSEGEVAATPETPQTETPEVVQPESPTIIPPEEAVIPAEEELKERQSKVVQERKGDLSTDALYYEPITNEKTLAKANELIDKYGEIETDRLFRDEKSGVPVALRKAIGYSLLDRASKVGDFERELYVGEGLASIETEAGQALQASKIYTQMSPGAQVLTVDKGMKKSRAKKVTKNIKRITRVKNEVDSVNAQVANELTGSPTRKNIIDKLNKRKESRDQKVAQAIAKLNSMKININGKLNDISQVIGAELYNGAIDVIEQAIKAGASVANAVDQAVAYINANFKEVWDEKTFRNQIFTAIGNIGTDPYRTLVNKGLKEMGADIDQIVKEHYSKGNIVKEDLTKGLMEKLGIDQADAQSFTDQIDQEFQKIASERKNKIIKRILGRKPLDRIQQANVDRIIEASNVGLLDEKDFRDQYADMMKWPKLTEEQAKEIRRLATVAQEKPMGRQRLDATKQLMNYIANLDGVEWMEVGKAIWYANMLSGPSTQALNIYANAGEVLAESYVTGMQELVRLIQTGKALTLPELTMGWINSLHNAVTSGLDVLITGRTPYKGGTLGKIGFPSITEFKKWKGGALNPLNYIKFVPRFMQAWDVFSYRQLQGIRSAQLAKVTAIKENKASPTVDIRKRASEITGKTKQQTAQFKQQAIGEGFKEGSRDFKLRVWELQEFNAPQDLQDDINDFAAHGTFNHPSEHTLGLVIKWVNSLIVDIPVLRAIVPYTTVVGNIANARLDWAPIISTVRVAKGGKGWGKHFVPYKGDERTRVAIKSATGTIVMSALLYMLLGDDEDKDNKKKSFIEVTSTGPKELSKQYELMQSGWRPHSMRIGNTWFKFQNSPLAIPLEIAGAFSDQRRYFGNKVTGVDAQLELALLATAQFWTDMSFLQGMNDFMSIFNSKDPASSSERKAFNFFSRFAKSLVVTNAVTQSSQIIQQIYDMPMKDANTLLDKLVKDIPALRDNLGNIYNSLGEPVTANILERLKPSGIHKAEMKGSPAWKLIIDNQAWIGKPDRNQEVYFIDENQKRTMTDDEYVKYALASGLWTRKLLESNQALIEKTIADYKLDYQQRKDLIYRFRSAARAIARAQLFAGVDVRDIDINNSDAIDFGEMEEVNFPNDESGK